MIENPSTKTYVARSSGSVRRWLVHTSLGVAFLAVGISTMVWPQWIAADNSHSAFELESEREKQFTDRLDQAHAQLGRIYDWQQDGRRVFLRDELNHFSAMVEAIARRDGAAAEKVKVSTAETSRFQSLALQAPDRDGVPVPNGEIEPRTVRVVVTGKFDAVYRTVATLCQQQKLFIPERWDLAPEHGANRDNLRAEVAATVFVVTEPNQKPEGSAAAGNAASHPLTVKKQSVPKGA